MAYDPALETARDRTRFALSDTSDAAPLVPDATYDAMLLFWGEAEGGAKVADALAQRFAGKPGRVTLPNGLTVAWADRVVAWRETAARLRAYGPVGHGTLNAAAGVITIGRVTYDGDPYNSDDAVGVPYG